MESIDNTIDDYRKAPFSNDEQSNQGYNTLADPTGGLGPTGPVFSETSVKPITINDLESSDSRQYRNAPDDNV
jgi:hypothetical protein